MAFMSDKSGSRSLAMILQSGLILSSWFLPVYLSSLVKPGPLLQIFVETGAALPAPTSFYLYIANRGQGLINVLGLLLFAASLAIELKGHPKIRPLARKGIGIFSLLFAAMAIASHCHLVYTLKALSRPSSESRPDSERLGNLVLEVSKAVQASVLKGVEQVPGKKESYFFVYEGPGCSKVSNSKNYKDLCEGPGCVLLPTGPESTSSDKELHFVYPRDPSLSFVADNVGPELLGSLNFDLRRDYRASARDPMSRYPWIQRVFKYADTELSYALQFRRVRVASGDSKVSAKSSFGNSLFEVQIFVFKDFDPKRALEKGAIPSSNVPVDTFLALVRVP
jgi:hypothetical protein